MLSLPGLESETRYSLQQNTVCFNGDLNVHFFPPFRTFFVEFGLDVYALDDMCGWFYDIPYMDFL